MERTGHGHIAMHAARKKRVSAMCGERSYGSVKKTADNLVLEAVGQTKQVDQEQKSKGASSAGTFK